VTITWQQARDKVRQDLWRPGTSGVPDDVVDRALHAALRELETQRRWLWLQNLTSTLTVATAGSTVDVPTHFGNVTSIAYLSGTNGYDILHPYPLAHVRDAATGTATGYPCAYALHDEKFYFDTQLKVGDEFELVFSSETSTDIAATIATPPVTLDLEQDTVIAAACAAIAIGYLRDEASAARFEAKYNRRLEMLMDIEDRKRADEHGGNIIPDTAYHVAANGYGGNYA
jgi:hypothetical protein